MNWYALNKRYVNYLRKYDKLVPDIEYTGRLKCFLGIVFRSKSGYDYFAPLTSYKPKFQEMSNDIDFYKLVGTNGKIYGAIDINNMIPVPQSEYKEISLDNLNEFRDFSTNREKKQYWKLLQVELSCINEKYIHKNAEKLFIFVTKYPSSPLAQRCCNFRLLEDKCMNYNLINNESISN